MMDIVKSLIYESPLFECIIVLAVLMAGFCIHGGILHKVIVTSEQQPSRMLVIAYKLSYNMPQADKHFSEVMFMLPTHKKIRITYDKNRRQVGFQPLYIFATGIILNEMGEQPDAEVSLFLVELGYKLHNFPQMSYVLTSTHPFRNPLSVRMARMRVYSKMKAYIQKRCLCAHPKIEIYGESSILFLVPLHRQDDFYVKGAEPTPKFVFKVPSVPNVPVKPMAKRTPGYKQSQPLQTSL